MPILNSWCERLFVISFTILISIILIDIKLSVLPIHGLYLLIYVLFILIITVWITCAQIQKLLKQNLPLEYQIDWSYLNWVTKNSRGKNEIKEKPRLPTNMPNSLNDATPIKTEKFTSNPEIKSIDERIELLANDIDNRFIFKWYSLISDEKTFPSESKVLLESLIRRVLQVSVQVDGSKLMCGALIILLKHLKEYRRALKRAAKQGGSIESVYRFTHIGNKFESTLDCFTHQLTGNILREFISWELWNSLPCRLLVSILSKRLTSYLLFYLSQPGWLNHKLITQFATNEDKCRLNLDKFSYLSLSDVDLSKERSQSRHALENGMSNVKNQPATSTPNLSPKLEENCINLNATLDKSDVTAQSESDSYIEQALTKVMTQQTAPILQRAEKTPPKIDSIPIPRSEPVKIHAPKSASKCWNEQELLNLSIGQDLLALEGLDNSDIQGFSGRRLWGYNSETLDQEPEKPYHFLWDLNETWFKDKDPDKGTDETRISPKAKLKRMKDNKEPSPPSNIPINFVANAIKPIVIKPTFLAGNVTATTLHNMRELQQSTVNNVVKPVSQVTEKAMHKIGDLQDEAVGVVEGIFDFGMAGLRKGLRFTGLQDQTGDDTSPKQTKTPVPKLIKLAHVTSAVEKSNTIDENVWVNPLAKESPNGYENQMLLEKSPNLVENESSELPNITETHSFSSDSPEYEETADLASTISKLRSLLQQKSSESSLNTPAISPMPFDDKSCPTPTDIVPDVSRTDGGMQRFARTVTGMFNTFKTALPGVGNEQTQIKSEQWIFVENETSDLELPSIINSLLIERRDFCTVDTAYEAMDTLDLLTESVTSQAGSGTKIQWESQSFEDELDDLDSFIPITKALWDIVSECLHDTKSALNQEPVMKALLLLSGSYSEILLKQYADKLVRSINKAIGSLPSSNLDCVCAMNLDEMVANIEKVIPVYIQQLFGHEDLKAGLKFFLSSLQSIRINQDIMLQLFELICSELIRANNQISPTPSA